MAPRGIGTMACMLIAGKLSSRFDPRKLMAFGLLLLLWSLYESTTWTPDIGQLADDRDADRAGRGTGLRVHPAERGGLRHPAAGAAHRRDGAAGAVPQCRQRHRRLVTFALLARNVQVVHSELGAFVTPFNRALQAGGAVTQYLDPARSSGAQVLDAIINNQAQIIAYIDDYKFMMLTTLPALLLLFFMRRPGVAPKAAEGHAAVLD